MNNPIEDISKVEFINKHLLREMHICIDILLDAMVFETSYHSFKNHDFMVSSYSDGSKFMFIPYEYSDDLINQVSECFPRIKSFAFFSDKKHDKPINNLNKGIYYVYAYPAEREMSIPIDESIKLVKVTDDNYEILERYCARHQSEFFERHPAKLTNIYQKSKTFTIDITVDIYIVSTTQDDVGFIITNTDGRNNYVEVGQLLIEDEFRKKGYGHKSLAAITREILAKNMRPYYATVDYTNLASISCCEKVGYIHASSRVHFDVNCEN